MPLLVENCRFGRAGRPVGKEFQGRSVLPHPAPPHPRGLLVLKPGGFQGAVRKSPDAFCLEFPNSVEGGRWLEKNRHC